MNRRACADVHAGQGASTEERGREARRHLHERLEQTLGEQAADTLMDEMNSLGRDQLASKHDIELFKGSMREEFASFRGEMREEFAAVRGEMGSMRGELTSTFEQRMNDQTRQLGMWLLGSNATLAALAFTAASLS